MIREIIRNDITSDICRLGLELNMHHKFCSYTTNTENQSADIRLSLPAGKKITIFWGDGASTVVTGEVITTICSHTYTDIKTYNLTVTGDYNDIMYLEFKGDGTYGGDIKYMPSGLIVFIGYVNNTFSGDIQYLPAGLTYFGCWGQNTISGDIQYLPSGLTFFNCGGNITISGDIQYLPSGLTSFSCYGQNTIFGDIQHLPSGLTSFSCYGQNTISGDIQYLPAGLTYFGCGERNTLSGDIQHLPAGLTYFGCSGRNTLSGDIQYLPSGLTFFGCWGQNTLFGDIQYLPSGLTFFGCWGHNTISEYTGKTWTTNMSYFILVPVSPGGLSSSEMDLLLNDLDEDLDWSGGGTIILTGANAPRTSASDNAVNNIIAEGGTVICNN